MYTVIVVLSVPSARLRAKTRFARSAGTPYCLGAPRRLTAAMRRSWHGQDPRFRSIRGPERHSIKEGGIFRSEGIIRRLTFCNNSSTVSDVLDAGSSRYVSNDDSVTSRRKEGREVLTVRRLGLAEMPLPALSRPRRDGLLSVDGNRGYGSLEDAACGEETVRRRGVLCTVLCLEIDSLLPFGWRPGMRLNMLP